MIPPAGDAEGGGWEDRPAELNEIPLPQLRVLLKGFPGDWRSDPDAAKGRPAPSAEKAAQADLPRIALPAPGAGTPGETPLREVLARRRSCREYSTAPLELGELGFLLWSAQGVTGNSTDTGEPLPLRAAPSAGGRYPLETYAVANRVDGLETGLYRYSPFAHELLALRLDPDLPTRLQNACYGDAMIAQAAAVIIFSAIPYRMEWKYAYLAHRMIALEAGHACQNLCLAAESTGAAACPVLAYHQPAVDHLIEADGEDEFAIYLASVGKRVEP